MIPKLVIDNEFDPDAAITPQICQILRERIIKNDLPPGTKLSETELARQYEVSRQPIREAFIKLAEEGLVIVRPQRKTMVTKIDYRSILQSRFIREAVEADIVALLAEAGDSDLVKELRHQLNHQCTVAQTSPLDFINEDMKFHRTLAEAANKEVAWKFIEGLNRQMDRVRFLSLGQFPVMQLVNAHKRITDHIEKKNAKEASAAMRTHLQRLIHDLPQIVNQNKEFFNRVDPDSTDNQPPTNHGGQNGV